MGRFDCLSFRVPAAHRKSVDATGNAFTREQKRIFSVSLFSADSIDSVDLQIWVCVCCKCVEVCCSLLQCVAVCCSSLKRDAVRCNAFSDSALQCSTDSTDSVDFQIWVCLCCKCVALHCSVLRCVEVRCSVLQCIIIHYVAALI